jgi:ParB family chromosome partitioning protein
MADKHEIIPLSLERLSTDLAHLRLLRPELVDSMEQSLARFGQLNPVVVRKGKRAFQIIDGFKRYHAAMALGWPELQANVLEISRRAATAMILTCNKNNRSLTDYEEALVLLALKQEHNMQQEEIAALLGYSASWVSRRLALVEKLDPAIKDELKLGVLSTTQAREIVQLPRGNQQEMVKTIIDHGLNTRQTTAIIDEFLKTTDREQQRYILDHPTEVLERNREKSESEYDARLSGQGNRLLRTIKITRRQMNRLLDEAERTASHTLTNIEWMILEPELVRTASSAKQLADFIEQILEKRKP